MIWITKRSYYVKCRSVCVVCKLSYFCRIFKGQFRHAMVAWTVSIFQMETFLNIFEDLCILHQNMRSLAFLVKFVYKQQ